MSTRDFTISRRGVATAKLAEFRRQCYRLADLTRGGSVVKTDAVDCLADIAIAHSFGNVDEVISGAFEPVPGAYLTAASYDDEVAL